MRFVSHTWNGFEICFSLWKSLFNTKPWSIVKNFNVISSIFVGVNCIGFVKLTVRLRKLLDNGVDEDLIESKTKSMIWSSTNTDKTSISYVESYWNSAKPIIYLKICNVLWELSLFKSDAELQRLLTKMAVIYFWTCKL